MSITSASIRVATSRLFVAMLTATGCYGGGDADPSATLDQRLELVEDARCLAPSAPVSRGYTCDYTLTATPYLTHALVPGPDETLYSEVMCDCAWGLTTPQPTCGDDARPVGWGAVCAQTLRYSQGLGSGVVSTMSAPGTTIFVTNYRSFADQCAALCRNASPDRQWEYARRGYAYRGAATTPPTREWSVQLGAAPTWSLASQMVCCAPPVSRATTITRSE